MDRKSLCLIIKNLRQESGVSMKTICMAMDLLPSSIYRFESGKHNFNLKLLFSYLKAINVQMVLSDSNNANVLISDYEQFVDWLIEIRTNAGYTQRKLAEKTGITQVTIANIESKKSVVTIDYFFKIIEALGYVLNIKKI